MRHHLKKRNKILWLEVTYGWGRDSHRWQEPETERPHFHPHAGSRVNWNWGKGMNSQSLPPAMCFLEQAPPPKSSISSPTSATSGGPSLQIPEPVEDICHSNQHITLPGPHRPSTISQGNMHLDHLNATQKSKVSFATQDNLLTVISCKIKNKSYSSNTQFASHFKREEWGNSPLDWTRATMNPAARIPSPVAPCPVFSGLRLLGPSYLAVCTT